MDFSDGLAVAAIALALSTIFLGVLFYRWQTEQGREITKTINDFAKEMHAVLGEIKGLTTGTREQLQDQFKWLLQAAVGEERATLASDVAQKLDALEGAFAGLEAKAGSGLNEQLGAEVEALKERVSSLSSELSAVARKAADAAAQPAAPRGSETPFLDELIQMGTFREAPLLDKAKQQEIYRRWRESRSVEPPEGKPET